MTGSDHQLLNRQYLRAHFDGLYRAVSVTNAGNRAAQQKLATPRRLEPGHQLLAERMAIGDFFIGRVDRAHERRIGKRRLQLCALGPGQHLLLSRISQPLARMLEALSLIHI